MSQQANAFFCLKMFSSSHNRERPLGGYRPPPPPMPMPPIAGGLRPSPLAYQGNSAARRVAPATWRPLSYRSSTR